MYEACLCLQYKPISNPTTGSDLQPIQSMSYHHNLVPRALYLCTVCTQCVTWTHAHRRNHSRLSIDIFFFISVPCNSPWYTNYKANYLHQCIVLKNFYTIKRSTHVAFCILYFSSNSCSTCFGQPCAHHQELTTAWCYSIVLVCVVAAGRLSSPVGIRCHFLYSLFLF